MRRCGSGRRVAEERLVSAVWLDAGKAYAYQQIVNPGPSELRLLEHEDEAKIKEAALGIASDRDALNRGAEDG